MSANFRIIVCTALFLLMLCGSQARGETYLVHENYRGTWHDANKTVDDDTNMCWAAAASNILKWGRWDVAASNTANLIFNQFKYYWGNTGGEVPWGYDWWFRGTYYTGVAIAGGGNYWPSRNPWLIFHAGTGDQLQLLDSYLRSGYGVTLGVQHRATAIRHAMTVWGFEYNPGYEAGDPRYYTHLYVTDSDDNLTELRRFEIGIGDMGFWYFTDEHFSNYKIEMAEGLERRWIPEFAPEGFIIDMHRQLNKLFLLEPFLSFDYKWEPPFPVPQPGDPCLFKVLIESGNQWQTLFETFLDQDDMSWQSLNIPVPQDLLGLHKLTFLYEGEGSLRLYRLSPAPLPNTLLLMGGGLAVLLVVRARQRARAAGRERV